MISALLSEMWALKKWCVTKVAHRTYLTFQIANNKGADQTVCMRLCCSQATKSGFWHRGPYDVVAQASWPSPGYAPAGYIETLFIFFVCLI